MSSVELNHVERRSSLGGEDAVLDVVVDQLDLDKVLQESGRLCLASFERSFERLKVGQDDLVGDVDGAADERQHRVRLLSLLLLGDQLVQPAGVQRVGQELLPLHQHDQMLDDGAEVASNGKLLQSNDQIFSGLLAILSRKITPKVIRQQLNMVDHGALALPWLDYVGQECFTKL